VAAEEEEIAVGVDEMPVDGFDLPPGVTSDEFSLYGVKTLTAQRVKIMARWPSSFGLKALFIK